MSESESQPTQPLVTDAYMAKEEPGAEGSVADDSAADIAAPVPGSAPSPASAASASAAAAPAASSVAPPSSSAASGPVVVTCN